MGTYKSKPAYIVCRGSSLVELEQEVNQAIKDGYTPTGGIVVIRRHKSSAGIFCDWYQAVTVVKR